MVCIKSAPGNLCVISKAEQKGAVCQREAVQWTGTYTSVLGELICSCQGRNILTAKLLCIYAYYQQIWFSEKHFELTSRIEKNKQSVSVDDQTEFWFWSWQIQPTSCVKNELDTAVRKSFHVDLSVSLPSCASECSLMYLHVCIHQ